MRNRFVFMLSVVITCMFLMLLAGCSGGIGVSLGAGGSVHNPNHKDLANVVKNTPIVATSTGKSFALPKVKKGEK